MKTLAAVVAVGVGCLAVQQLHAGPTVRLNTVVGAIDIELLHEQAPLTVTNFLNYATTGRYRDSFFHRSVPGFVVQGGGFTYPGGEEGGPYSVPADDPVANEPGVSNTRGTVAMAKLGGQPDSATSQFFFNLTDNSGDLDDQNGGFTVFGQVVGDGMQVVDQIAALDRVNAGSPFDTLPVLEVPDGNIAKDQLVIVNDAEVLETGIVGDYNANGSVEQADLNLVLLNWGQAAAPLPGGWFNDLPDGTIDQEELNNVLLNWGNSATSATAGSLATEAAVPEPTTGILAAVVGMVLAIRKYA